MTTEAGGTLVNKPLAPGPAEMLVHFWTCTATNDDVITIPDSVTYVHYATAVANATSHGGAAALSNEETTIETATKLDEVLFQAGNDEYLTGFSISDIDAADSVTGTGTAASTIKYYKVAPGPSQGYATGGVSDGGMIAVYFEATVTTNESIPFDKVGIDHVYGAICFSVAANAFTAIESTVGDSDEKHKVKISTAVGNDKDVRGIVWGVSDDVAKAANTGTTLTDATGIKIYKIWPGPAECNVRYWSNDSVDTDECVTITGMTEARFAISHSIAAGISTISTITTPSTAITEANKITITEGGHSSATVRGIVIGDLGTAGWSD